MNPQLQAQVLEIMGAPQGKPLDTFIRKGVPLVALEHLVQHGVSAVAVGVLTSRTLHRRRVKREQLSRAEGDRLYRVNVILLRAEQVFGHPYKARRSPLLGWHDGVGGCGNDARLCRCARQFRAHPPGIFCLMDGAVV